MTKQPYHPSKRELAAHIAQIIKYLHEGRRSAADLLIEDLKASSLFLDSKTQEDVLIFSEQVQFQYDYDPWHKVTPDVQQAADRLIKDLGIM